MDLKPVYLPHLPLLSYLPLSPNVNDHLTLKGQAGTNLVTSLVELVGVD